MKIPVLNLTFKFCSKKTPGEAYARTLQHLGEVIMLGRDNDELLEQMRLELTFALESVKKIQAERYCEKIGLKRKVNTQ